MVFTPNVFEAQVAIRFPIKSIERLDEWCSANPMKPTRAEAIRLAVELLLSNGGRLAIIPCGGKVS